MSAETTNFEMLSRIQAHATELRSLDRGISQTEPEDRRESRRWPVRCGAKVCLLGKYIPALAVDVSAGGVKLSGKLPPVVGVGTKLSVTLGLDGLVSNDTLRQAEVVWISERYETSNPSAMVMSPASVVRTAGLRFIKPQSGSGAGEISVDRFVSRADSHQLQRQGNLSLLDRSKETRSRRIRPQAA
jgi:hypothetical protein